MLDITLPRHDVALALLASFLLVLSAGCSDDLETVTDTGQADTSIASGDVETDTSLPNVNAPGTTHACESDADCSNGLCLANVCLSDPLDFGFIAHEADTVVQFPERIPNLGCYPEGAAYDPNDGVDPPAADQTVTLWGDIERFGSDGTVQNVCVTVYDHARWLELLSRSECNDLQPGQERLDCFHADPCRCDALSGDAQQECYRRVGLCSKLEGSAAASCAAQYPEPIVYGYTVSTCEDGAANPVDCADENARYVFRVPDVPPNRPLVIKTSGDPLRWVDTVEFGVVAPWNRVAHDVVDPVTGAQDTYYFEANIITVSSWSSIPTTAGHLSPIDRNESGAIAGRLQDCGEAGRANAEPDYPQLDASQPIVHATIGFAVRPERTTYFNGDPADSLPNPGRVDSNSLGLYAALDVPFGLNRAAARVDLASAPADATCAPAADGVACLGGQRDLFVLPYSVSLVTFEGNWQSN